MSTRRYKVSQVKIHYSRPSDVTGVEEVTEDQLFRELEARGVPKRLWGYEDGTSQTVNGEFTQWTMIRRTDVASTWDTRNSSQENLVAFADIMADALKNNLVPVEDALVPLHHAALELNRRHGHASLQTAQDAAEAADVLDAIASLDGDMDVDWAQVVTDQARAFGALLDKGTGDDLARALVTGRPVLRDCLEMQAVAEGRERGFDHRPHPVARLVPAGADTMVAPF